MTIYVANADELNKGMRLYSSFDQLGIDLMPNSYEPKPSKEQVENIEDTETEIKNCGLRKKILEGLLP